MESSVVLAEGRDPFPTSDTATLAQPTTRRATSMYELLTDPIKRGLEATISTGDEVSNLRATVWARITEYSSEAQWPQTGQLKVDQSYTNPSAPTEQSLISLQANGSGQDVKRAPQAKAYVTSLTEPLMKPLEAIVRSKVAEVGIGLRKIEWTVFKYKDRKRTDLILRVFVQANRAQALAFWEHLGSRVDEWLDRLPPSSADVVVDRLSTEVIWA